MVSLGGYPQSTAYGVSDDGTVITGYSSFIDGQQAFRWTASDGLIGLGDLNTESIKNSYGYGISGDGNYIVGISKSEAGDEAFRWNETDGMIGLGDFEGGKFYSVANAVSADGSVVVGSGSDDEGELAFRWTEETGLQSIVDWLAESNVAVEEGFSLTKATDVSDDGNTVVGNGSSTRFIDSKLTIQFTHETTQVCEIFRFRIFQIT
ncbi:MAG: hypothetical protein NWT02_08305 [Opitutales bacterium]|jgi:probable HAF family extracellular repeat protein|nr:hypothetical protein [Opitutales bacterium]MDP4644183.1 hypothetical protein [Opitutales bacterium]MDP4776725.1 hypothetical protein [Opitutales bacterium]MDP4883743.1 hypothetical protein [Opitutales bacterium]MDP5079390.1 hypothetical protein [Opitutales bacterium]